MIGRLIGLMIGAIVAAVTLPIGISYLQDSGNWSGVTGAALTLGSVVLPIVIIAVAVVAFVKEGGFGGV